MHFPSLKKNHISFADIYSFGKIFWAHLIVFFGISSTLVVKGGYTYWAIALSLVGIFYIIKNNSLQNDKWFGDAKVQHARIWIFGSFAAFVLFSFAINIYHKNSLGSFQVILPFLIYPALAILIWKKRVTPIWFFMGAATGAIGAGCFATIQVFFLGIGRAHGHINPITFGDNCVVLAAASIISLTQLDFRVFRHEKFLKIWLASGALFGIWGSLLSGSKGGWLSLLTIILIGVIGLMGRISKKRRLGLLGMLIFATGLIFALLPDSIFKDRLEKGWNGFTTYVATGKVTEMSVSLRFDMWAVGWKIFTEQPILGSGGQRVQQRRAELANSGDFSPIVAKLNTFDNEYINRLSATGVAGLFISLFLFIAPIIAFSRFRKSSSTATNATAILGMTLPVLYMEFGISVAILETNAFRQLYASWIVLLLALIANQCRKDSNENVLQGNLASSENI